MNLSKLLLALVLSMASIHVSQTLANTQSISRGSPEEWYQVGCYLYSTNSYVRAAEIYEGVFARAGDTLEDRRVKALAAFDLGKIYYLHPQDGNHEKSIKFLEYALNQYEVDWIREHAALYLGEIYSSKENHQKAFDYFKTAFQRANAWNIRCEAACRLGETYYHGRATPKNNEMAQHYFENAIASSDCYVDPKTYRAFTYLGQIAFYRAIANEHNESAEPSLQDYQSAYTYFTVADQRNPDPQSRAIARAYLGVFAYFGLLGSTDYDLARRYFEIAYGHSEWANAHALLHLGMMYYYGQGVARNFGAAREYFQMAAENTCNLVARARASAFLGKMYYDGCSVEKNLQQANFYFTIAAEQEVDAWARNSARADLAMVYYRGDGVEKDLQKAREYSELAACQYSNDTARSRGMEYLALLDAGKNSCDGEAQRCVSEQPEWMPVA